MLKAIYEFQFGYITILYEGETLFSLICSEKRVDDSDGVRSLFSDDVFRQITEYIDGRRMSFDFNYVMSGTPFRLSVWKELLKIPYGETRTYKEIAAAVCNEKAARAVGGANNKNPLHIIVPCHRVIGADGSFTGYAGGMALKKKLLETERENIWRFYDERVLQKSEK